MEDREEERWRTGRNVRINCLTCLVIPVRCGVEICRAADGQVLFSALIVHLNNGTVNKFGLEEEEVVVEEE